jgi:hypothetical protein
MAFLLPYLPALLSAAGSIGGGMLNRRGSNETANQGTQRQLIDQLMASLSGNGPYSDLFQMDEAAFQKSYVDPAKQRFNDQIAPQIQQNYIASGQQRGTGLDDTLARAGVDMDQLLNQQYMGFQEKGKDRMSQIINQILGAGSGAAPAQSMGNAFGQSVGGYLQGSAFQDLLKSFGQNQPQLPNNNMQSRAGFSS